MNRAQLAQDIKTSINIIDLVGRYIKLTRSGN